jgi:hypothetical protein
VAIIATVHRDDCALADGRLKHGCTGVIGDPTDDVEASGGGSKRDWGTGHEPRGVHSTVHA